MQMTTSQLDFLYKLGLPWHADEPMATRFAEALDPSQRGMFEALSPVRLSGSRISLAGKLIVSREAGTIKGVSVIAIGTTLPSGGGVGAFDVDRTTLQQVADAINASGIGVKSRVTHPELSGDDDDLPHRIGYIRNARATDRAVLADFVAHDADNTHVKTLMSIAEADPSSCGVSIVATDSTFENLHDGRMVLRVNTIDAADFVGTPAANPAGLLAASAQRQGTNTMLTTANTGTDAAYKVAQDALLIKAGVQLAAFDHDGHIVTDAWGRPQLRRADAESISLASGSMLDVAEWLFRNVGPVQLQRELPKLNRPKLARLAMTRSELVRYFPGLPMSNHVEAGVALAHATGDFPGLTADTLNKVVLTHYANARRSWRAWAKRGTVTDFRQADRVRLEDAPGLERLDEGASIDFGVLPEAQKEVFALGRYARGLRFTREAMLNDDAEGFGEIGRILGDAAGRLEDVLAYGLLTANAATGDGSAFFSTAHGNVTTGAITLSSLAAASAHFAKLQNSNGDTLDIQPGVLVVPAELRHVAENTTSSLVDVDRHESETRLKLVSSGHLSASSSSQWFVGTDPRVMAAIEVAFLRGNESPRVANRVDFDSDGMLFKIVHELQAAVVDPRLMIRSTGS